MGELEEAGRVALVNPKMEAKTLLPRGVLVRRDGRGRKKFNIEKKKKKKKKRGKNVQKFSFL
jgi:hypothetical protein